MNSRPRGYCVVVNMKTGHAFGETRLGSDVDVTMINSVFSQLHFEVLRYVDLKSEVCQCIYVIVFSPCV